MTATAERDLTPPHGTERPQLMPTVERFDNGTIRLELGYRFEHGPNVRASFIGTPQTIIRDFLTPLMTAAMDAAEPERDDVYAVVAATEDGVLDDPALEPIALFAAGWLTAHPQHAVRHQMTLADAMHDRSVNAKFVNFLEASVPTLDGRWRP